VTDATEVANSVLDDDPGIDPPESSPRFGLGSKFLVLTIIVGVVAGVASFMIRLPYLALEPGNTFETEKYVVVDGAEAYTSPGEVSFVTLTQRRLTPVDWLISKFQSSDDIVHEDELLRGRTFEEQREENALLMISSQNSAIAAALAELGFETAEPAGVVLVDVVEGGPIDGLLARNDVITEIDGERILTQEQLFDVLTEKPFDATVVLLAGRPGAEPQEISVSLTTDTAAFIGIMREATSAVPESGAAVDGVIEGGAVDGLLEPGDRIVSLDGEMIESFESLVAALADLRSGDVVSLEAVRSENGEETVVTGTITLGARTFERAGIASAATQLRDAELPFEVSFTTEDIGGPSAGLAFTLTVLDVLTDGDLTGGANIVVTGTIDRAGNVGSIGGVKQKAFAAKEADADIFIVPVGNLEAAQLAVDDLRIESAGTLDEALEIIAEFGGNAGSLPTNGEL
jgi:PDZ domain-containing secreted protein